MRDCIFLLGLIGFSLLAYKMLDRVFEDFDEGEEDGQDSI